MVRDLRCLKAHLTIYCYDPTVHRPVNYNNPPASPKFSTTYLESELKDFLAQHVPNYCHVFTSVTCENTMTDYGVLKVQDLKKLLSDRKLATGGNKADLIKRLQDADKEAENSAPAAAPGMSHSVSQDYFIIALFTHAPEPHPFPERINTDSLDSTAAAANAEDEIDYEEDDVPAPAAPAAEPAAPAEPTTTAAAPAQQGATTTTTGKPVESEPAADAETSTGAPAEAEAAPAPPVFTANLPETDPDSEAAKRLARAKRFGISEDEMAAKKAARAARFGLEKDDIARTLDAPLPERPQNRKRGRGGEGEGDPAAKDGSEPAAKKVAGAANGGGKGGAGREGGKQQQQQRNGRPGGSARPGGGQDKNQPRNKQDGGAAKAKQAAPVAVDPAEKAKMEARAKRFAS